MPCKVSHHPGNAAVFRCDLDKLRIICDDVVGFQESESIENGVRSYLVLHGLREARLPVDEAIGPSAVGYHVLSPVVYKNDKILVAYESWSGGGGFQAVIWKTSPTTVIVQK